MDKESFFRRGGISNLLVLPFIQTYDYELTLIVGKSCLATLGSANSFGIRVSALTSKGRSVCSLGSTGGGCCTWLFHIKQKYCVQQHAFLCSNIQHSTFHHQPKAGGFETTDCLECLQILNILYMAGRSTLKLEIGHCALY